jgi:hypothetical protein
MHILRIKLGIPRRMVSSFPGRFNKHNSIENFSRPGGPRKTFPSTDHYLTLTAETRSRILLTELKGRTKVDICTQIIRRRLREVGIRKWKAVLRSLLNRSYASKRLKWANSTSTLDCRRLDENYIYCCTVTNVGKYFM